MNITGGGKMNQRERDKIRIIIHAFADQEDYNAQNLNAIEISHRLNPNLFDITFFYKNKPDTRLVNRENIQLIKISDCRIVPSFVILKRLLSRKYDIFFYVRTFYLDYLYFTCKKTFLDRKITIHTIENALPYPANERYNKIAKWNALNSNYVFSVSNYVAETAEKEYGIKTPVMYVGVDTNLFTPPKEKIFNSKIKILYVGSFQERKKPYLVLEAAKHFPDAVFHLIGSGPLKERLFSMKNELNNVKISSNLLTEEFISCYQNSDIFLFPSIHEGFPKVTIEAASCGLPAIVFDSYKPETVLDGETGFIVKDFQEMLDKLKTLINDSNLRYKMGKKAREYAKSFDWDVIVRKWEGIFVEAVRGK
jgi:glycosyltransferase involved in cell wall biosynthesis